MLFASGGKGEETWYEGISDLLVTNNYERVYKIAFIITQDVELSKDITQEAFLTAFSKISNLRDMTKFGSWVCTIAINLSKDMLRQKIQDKKMTVPLYDKDGNLRNDLDTALLNIPEEWYEEQEEITTIIKSVDGLDVEERQIILLKYFEEFSYVQIAEELKMKESTVRMKALRAKKKISEKLSRYSGIKGVGNNG